MIKNNKGQSLIELLAAIPVTVMAMAAIGALALFLVKTSLRVMAENRALADLAAATVHISDVGRFSTECFKVRPAIVGGQIALECKVDFRNAEIVPPFTNVRFEIKSDLSGEISLGYSMRNPVSATEPWTTRLTYFAVQSFELCDSLDMNDADTTKCSINTASGQGNYTGVGDRFFRFRLKSYTNEMAGKRQRSFASQSSYFVRNRADLSGTIYYWGFGGRGNDGSSVL